MIMTNLTSTVTLGGAYDMVSAKREPWLKQSSSKAFLLPKYGRY